MNKALFLDRDGVINVEKNYLYKIDDFEFIDGVFDAVGFFRRYGFKVIVVTNQAGIARDLYSEKDFAELTTWMLNRFLEEGSELDAVLHCPHHPDITGICDCRKPAAGMIVSAMKQFDIDMQKSILVGDKKSDILAGGNAGMGLNILVESGHFLSDDDKRLADLVVPSIASYEKIFRVYCAKVSQKNK